MNADVKQKLEECLAKYGISKAKASRDMGYSSAMLSAYTTGNYNGDVKKLEDNIIRWVTRQDQAHSRKRIPVVETLALKQMFNAIQLAHTEHDIALIIADAGSGKTTAARYYAAKNENTVVLINVVAGMNRKMLVTEIAKQVGLITPASKPAPLNQLIQDVAEELAVRDSLVILDEADYLKADALEFVRRLVYDLGESGLVLIGLPRLRGMIQNLRNDHRQLESRIGISIEMTGLDKSDAMLIAKTVWNDVSSDVVNSIYAASKNDVRQFAKIIERMQNIMVENNLEIPTVEAAEMASSYVLRRR